jgi:hypothetical protein
MIKYRLHIILFVLTFFLQINDIISQVNQQGFVPMTEEQIKEFFKNFEYSERQLFPTIKRILDTMKLQYFPSDKFIFEYDIEKTEEFESLPRFKYMLRGSNPYLEAKDGEFVGVFDLSAYLLKDSEKQPSVKRLNECHFAFMRCILFLSRGYKYPKMAGRLRWISWKTLKRKMHYQPVNYMNNKFNADTVITYKIRLKSGERFREKYKHCEALILTKTNVGCVVFYCFYTKEGYRKRDEYIREIGQMFRYK